MFILQVPRYMYNSSIEQFAHCLDDFCFREKTLIILLRSVLCYHVIDLPKFLFIFRRKIKFGISRNLSSTHKSKSQSLSAPKCDLRGQKEGQIQNLHKILREISLSQLLRWPLKFRWYSLILASLLFCNNQHVMNH